jgi:Protein of unknown function (DUF3592)
VIDSGSFRAGWRVVRVNPLQLAAAGVWALGAVFLIGGLVQRRRFGALLRDGVRTEAIVVGHDRRHDGSHDRYYPAVTFPTNDGGVVTRAVSRFGSTRPMFAVGQQVRVVYQRNDPDRMEILASGAQPSSNATLVFVGAGICALLGLILLVLPYP